MTVLGFDTSASRMSVTLTWDDRESAPSGKLHAVRDTGLHHAEHLAPTVRALLADAALAFSDLDLVVCAGGPGSFTGLRIGMATAKGFAAAGAAPFVAVGTLDMWAAVYSYWPGIVVPALNAKKGRFYAALYRAGRKLTEDLDEEPGALQRRVMRAADARSSDALSAGPHAVLVVGPDSAALTEAVATSPGEGFVAAPETDALPSEALCRLGALRFRHDGPAPEGAGPVYVRKSDAELGRPS